jgi:glycosyltransferase involved in cell wall biosynthesis
LGKIALFIISDGIGGAEQVVWQLINGFREKERFYLIVNNEIAEYFSKLLSADHILNIGNVYVHKGSQIKLIKLLYRFSNYRLIRIRLIIKKVKLFLQKNSIRIIHAHLDYALYTANLLKEKDYQLKIIYTVHGVLGLIEDKSIIPDISPLKINFKSISCLVFVSNYVKEVYLSNKIPINNSQVINNGIEIPLKPNDGVKSISPGKFKILYVGGAKFVKGFDLLIETVKILKESELENRFEVMVLGDVPKNSVFFDRIVSQSLEKYFDIVGFVNPPKHLEYFAKADLLFIPSRSETFCLAAIEGIINNIPIVASNVGGLSEVIEDGRNGLLAVLDPKEFALKIIDVFNNRDCFSAKTQEANRELFKKFDAVSMCSTYLELYEKVIKL